MNHTITAPLLMRVSDVALLLYGQSTTATKARVVRMVDRGELRAVRVGARGDRWIPRQAVERLLEANS